MLVGGLQAPWGLIFAPQSRPAGAAAHPLRPWQQPTLAFQPHINALATRAASGVCTGTRHWAVCLPQPSSVPRKAPPGFTTCPLLCIFYRPAPDLSEVPRMMMKGIKPTVMACPRHHTERLANAVLFNTLSQPRAEKASPPTRAPLQDLSPIHRSQTPLAGFHRQFRAKVVTARRLHTGVP